MGNSAGLDRDALEGWRENVRLARATFADLSADTTIPELEAIQDRLSGRVSLVPFELAKGQNVLGVDVQYEAVSAVAAAVMVDPVSLSDVSAWDVLGVAAQSYQHGFLAFRELPLVLDVLAEVDEVPGVILYDGNGTLHPKGFGAACHLGVLLDVPVIGVSKNVAEYRPFAEVERGQRRVLEGGSGALLVTRDRTNPVCVSPGHKVDLDTALKLVLALSITRIPEPTRLADQRARRGAKSLAAAHKVMEDMRNHHSEATTTFKFGDSAELCHDLLSLVRGGAKRATCGALSDYETGLEPRPVVGRRDIALSWDGTPALVIRTVKVEEIRFCDVTEEMALAEGENNTLEGWRRDHEAYFRRNGGFDPEMMLLFEHFEMVEDLAE